MPHRRKRRQKLPSFQPLPFPSRLPTMVRKQRAIPSLLREWEKVKRKKKKRMSCSHQHHSCGHNHGEGDDDDHVEPGQGQQDLLYSLIDKQGVTCLNESSPDMALAILKPFDQRKDETTYLESDCDDQLILRIPFTSSVKIRSLLFKSGPPDQTPDQLHLYVNLDHQPLDFDSAASSTPPPTSKLESVPVTREVVEFPLRASKFSDVRNLTIFVPSSLGGETSRIYFLGFKGESSNVGRSAAPTNIVYESAPRLQDHAKVKGTESGANSFGQGR
ncbi:DUF1000-domain-containing protein [Violaceomyces palustris]|uniref:DUF1000-domain-containing protein n=1 Tax=Violaceomyces palustris TaxID=1673888 RepID=A0ACD0P2V9_9BASI|nr:DUF1000-domain-containing protein [Violaceomyces palustris]